MWYGSLNDSCSLYQEEIVVLLRYEMKTLVTGDRCVQYNAKQS